MSTPHTDPSAPPAGVPLVQAMYDCLAHGEWDRLRTDVFAPDITWTIPGHNPISGTKRGVEEAIAFLRILPRANYAAELVYLGGNDQVVIEIHRGRAQVGAARLDVGAGAVYTIANGRISSIWNLADDQFALDAFYWQVFPLKPLPDRIALP